MKKQWVVSSFAFVVTLLWAAVAFAADAKTGGASSSSGWIGLATGLGLGLAAFGGAIGQGRVGAAAMEGLARNPQAAKAMNTPMILALALIESLVIYSLVISFFLIGKM